MLITFKSDAYADITMFGHVAQRLLKMMGHSGTVPGAVLAEDVPAALARLKRAIEQETEKIADTDDEHEDEESDELAVSLTHRALPLIELLAAAAARHRDVMWEKTT
jgi:hypothetical protein